MGGGGQPMCLGRRKTFSLGGCSQGSGLLNLAPPMAAPVLAKLKADFPIGIKRHLGYRRQENAQRAPSEFLRTVSQWLPRLWEGSGRIKWRSGQSECFTSWPEQRGSPESLTKDARKQCSITQMNSEFHGNPTGP